MTDCYLREFDAKVVGVKGNEVYLDRSAFYPGGGGQPCDTGVLRFGDNIARVVDMKGEAHIIDGPAPKIGDDVRGVIDWERRYKIMRTHTALHIVAGVAYQNYGVKITGNKLYEGYARVDLSFERMSKELAQKIIDESNEVVRRDIPIKIYFITKEEFKNRPELMRVAPHLYEKYDNIRIVDIVGFDVQADGGTHVKSTAEVGKIFLEKYESKGRVNKRIYIRLSEI